jgi:hypothetical protein
MCGGCGGCGGCGEDVEGVGCVEGVGGETRISYSGTKVRDKCRLWCDKTI